MKIISIKAVYLVITATIISGVYGQIKWNWQNPYVTGQTFYDAAWNGRQLIVVGEGGLIATSYDDTTWILRNSMTTVDLRSVTWADSLFITVGQEGTLLTSPDGIRWRNVKSGTHSDLYTVVWDGKRVVAAGDDGKILVSSHGVDWESAERGTTNLRINSVAWNDSLHLAVGERGGIYRSSDLSDLYQSLGNPDMVWWETIIVDGVDRDLYSITWADSEFIAEGENSMGYCASLRSKNGQNWTVSCFAGGPLYSVLWTGSEIITTGHSIDIRSPDDDWERTYSPRTELYSVINKGDQLVAAGAHGCILKSSDAGASWTLLGSATQNMLQSVIWAGNQYVAVGDGGTIVTSADGSTWTKRKSPISGDLREVVWTGTQLMAVGYNAVITSTDGILWDSLYVPPYNDFMTVIWTGSQYVVGCEAGRVKFSPDGHEWTAYSTGSERKIIALAWSGKCYTCIDDEGCFFTSMDGMQWEEIGYYMMVNNCCTILSAGGQMFAFGTSRMATSQDGSEWTGPIDLIDLELGRYPYLKSVVWTGREFVALSRHSILSSVDGISWDQRCTDERFSLIRPIAFNGSTFVAVGEYGCILTSPYDSSGLTAVNDTRTQGTQPESAFSIDIADRTLGVFPSYLYRGQDVGVAIYSVTGRKIVSAIYRGITGRIDIPLNGFANGVYMCIVTGGGRKKILPFTVMR